MRLPGRERDRERLSRREQMALADDLIDARRTQTIGERRRGIVSREKVGHDALTRSIDPVKCGSVQFRIIRHFP
jgi:hypothetical protein